MSHGHEHDHDLGPIPGKTRNRLLAVLIPLVAATIVGIVVLWPSHSAVGEQDKAVAVRGVVTDIHGCDKTLKLPSTCIMGTVELDQSDGGETVEAGLPYGENTPTVEVGDRVVLSYAKDAPEGQQYVWA